MSLRSPLSRVTGAGSAKAGTEHWWAERVSSVALLPLTAWFVYSLLTLPILDYQTVKTWIATPLASLLAVLLVAATTYHSWLGVQVVVEDYVHATGTRVVTLLLLRFLHVLVGGAAIFAILHVAFGA